MEGLEENFEQRQTINQTLKRNLQYATRPTYVTP